MSLSLHQHTPLLTVIDPRGLSVRTTVFHRLNIEDAIAARTHHQVFNANGHLSQQWDSRLLKRRLSEVDAQPNLSTIYSLGGQALQTMSVDAGLRIVCNGVTGLLRDSWDGRNTHQRYQYDELMRPLAIFERASEDPIEQCVERFHYSGAGEEAAHGNCCGQLMRHDDPAGSLLNEVFGLSGKPLTEKRRFLITLEKPDWPELEAEREALLESRNYTTQWRLDPFGAVVEQTDAVGHVQRFEMNIAGLPYASSLDGVVLLKSAGYNAFGQMEVEQGGNEVITTASYSPVDGRLFNLKAEKPGGKVLLDLLYQYDPVGNINRIEDVAQPVQWFAQQMIQAVSTYTYDTLYQLICATGRENVNQTFGKGLPSLEAFGAADDSRWRNYSQTYSYDSSGNLTLLNHHAGAGNSCTREMVVDERSNRSLFKDGSPIDFAKGFDANGNQRVLAAGQAMQWNARNQLCQVTQVLREEPDGQDDDVETYIYDGDGHRVRKVRRAKTRDSEHVSEVRYLPGLEIRTRTLGAQLHVVTVPAGRNSVRWLHWEGGLRKGIDNDQLRYSLSDHLGSSTLELDKNAELISQECYYPYGGTAWWAAQNVTEAKYKIIRYSGKERDATGLYYYGYRYYLPHVCRWISADPAGTVDGLNMYCMVKNNPITLYDPDGLAPIFPFTDMAKIEKTRVESIRIMEKTIKILDAGKSAAIAEIANYFFDDSSKETLDGWRADIHEVLSLSRDFVVKRNLSFTVDPDSGPASIEQIEKKSFDVYYHALKKSRRDSIGKPSELKKRLRELKKNYPEERNSKFLNINKISLNNEAARFGDTYYAHTFMHEMSHAALDTIDYKYAAAFKERPNEIKYSPLFDLPRSNTATGKGKALNNADTFAHATGLLAFSASKNGKKLGMYKKFQSQKLDRA